jgi:hypothetical protein
MLEWLMLYAWLRDSFQGGLCLGYRMLGLNELSGKELLRHRAVCFKWG